MTVVKKSVSVRYVWKILGTVKITKGTKAEEREQKGVNKKGKVRT